MSRSNDNKKPLTKALFLEKLSIHGADFTRWDNVDAGAAQKFLQDHDSVRVDYERAKALDDALSHYKVPDEFDVEALIGRASDQINQSKVSSLAEAREQTVHRKKGMVYYWGGGAAIAASLMLMILTFNQQPSHIVQDNPHNQAPLPQSESALTAGNEFAAVQQEEAKLFAVWERALAEDLAQREIISLWNTAQAAANAPPENASGKDAVMQPQASEPDVQINRFLENNYVPTIEDDVLEPEMNLWELYLNSEG